MLNPEKLFFYVSNKYISKLGTGDHFIFRLKPGEYTLSVKESIAFMSGFESGKATGNFKAGKEHLIRYSKEFSAPRHFYQIVQLFQNLQKKNALIDSEHNKKIKRTSLTLDRLIWSYT
ncbi:hypothetical protein P3339_08170 [Microbulbifer sp. MLAF003]|uniref:hypothetical protein n=1 Tax=Microbulbifer sp. MLAF003 TaxID=3032582 RepID=UPI0024AD7BE1|nr:hypothetical protein [Microbulbifer sp. MLAF003]WHI52724.1 hypothetical protein P3339_08170 [Microbulbifer sp. MLAF003]